MTYDPKSLSVLAYANGFTLWHYRTGTSLVDLTQPGYLDPAQDVLRAGDIILVNSRQACRHNAALILVASSDRLGVRLSVMGQSLNQP